ncbi:MAG: 30S ribosomal protein S13 [Candidatus Aenigmatarchaeota archaeon]
MAKQIGKEKGQEIIRLAETDLDGQKDVARALMKIKGISFSFANAIAHAGGFYGKKLSELNEAEIKKLEDMLHQPEKYGIPVWLFNRRKDPTGQTRHLLSSQLDFAVSFDINELKRIKCYRGVRHAAGLPVRGQRTRSSFRKGRSVGVIRKKAQPGSSTAQKKEGK